MKNLFKKSKNNQKFIFCIFTPKENTEALIKKYKYLISECINRYGRFTIFVFKKKQKIFTIQSFPKNKVDKVDIIYIDKKHDFLDYINNKTLFAIDEISRDLRYFNIRRLINKENIKLIYIMNIGFIPNTTYSQNKEISFKNKIYLIKKFLIKFFCRVLIILDIYPKTQFYFESNEKVVKKYNRSFIRKLIFKNPSLKFLANYFFIEKINSNSYERFLDYRRVRPKNRILFIDGNFEHKDILYRENNKIKKNKAKYFKALDSYLTFLGKILKKKIYISLHPSSNISEYRKFFKFFNISKGNTFENIYNSSLIIFHESSAVMDAMIAKKNIISFKTKLLGNYYSNRINLYINRCNFFSIDIDNPIEKNQLTKNLILKKIKQNKNKSNYYISHNLLSDKQIKPSNKILNKIEYFMKKINR